MTSGHGVGPPELPLSHHSGWSDAMCGRLSQYAALHEFVDALSMRAKLVGEPTKEFGEKNNLALNKYFSAEHSRQSRKLL
ncbi:hypothetical protein [Pseudomonas aeruginosa]|uniref:hypothetical protein n=1 Tax=Pseudomonas aeruginosa TaxID=287 RepID=UPI0022481AD1|nr:hypothetical protein [Pseudomonas aeruginosa]EIU1659315.1 hypothetical protein [Pseudomonas aeruginosa]MCX2516709.1 hypothetical protein [Pseudomonas aeruginosa]